MVIAHVFSMIEEIVPGRPQCIKPYVEVLLRLLGPQEDARKEKT